MKLVLDFLSDLAKNNNKSWFDENRQRYEIARTEFSLFVDQLIPAIKSIDNRIGDISSKQCMFRIYRDVRFSKDKRPYKTNFGAFVSNIGRKSRYAGYYLHIEPEKSMLGGGLYMPQPDILKAVREEILDNATEYKSIIYDSTFKKLFGEVWGDKLKMAPRGFPKDNPDIDLVKQKSFTALHSLTNNQVLESAFFDYILNVFREIYKINEFINRVIDNI
ncbi:MAG: DUF2461 domain-containing protein [Chlorobi bacterium]|nr:DUF2461 domain-containing protein [Chlorobiota bacterium]